MEVLVEVLVEVLPYRRFQHSYNQYLKRDRLFAPSVQILYPPDRSSITSASKVRLLASASDPDGNLVGVQFYINGIAYA